MSFVGPSHWTNISVLSFVKNSSNTKTLRLFIYGILASLGVLGLTAGLYPAYGLELFLGWILPVLAGTVTLYFIGSAAQKDPFLVTKTIAKGFALKMVYYGAAILTLFKLYSFEPIPFICSFSGFFLGLHVLEAVIIKRISQSYKTNA